MVYQPYSFSTANIIYRKNEVFFMGYYGGNVGGINTAAVMVMVHNSH